MKVREALMPNAAVLAVLFASVYPVKAVVFTGDTVIPPLDTTYDGAAVVISNSVLTVDGAHCFASVRIASDGTLIHISEENGKLSISVSITDEMQRLVGTNAAPLASSNVLTAAQRSSAIRPPPVERIGIKHGILQ